MPNGQPRRALDTTRGRGAVRLPGARRRSATGSSGRSPGTGTRLPPALDGSTETSGAARLRSGVDAPPCARGAASAALARRAVARGRSSPSSLTVHHNGWLYYQGGDQTLVLHDRVAASGTAPSRRRSIGYAWSFLLAPFALARRPEPRLARCPVDRPHRTCSSCCRSRSSRLRHRHRGSPAGCSATVAAGLWVIVPYVGIPLFRAPATTERTSSSSLPQPLGLTVMADFPSMVVVLAAALLRACAPSTTTPLGCGDRAAGSPGAAIGDEAVERALPRGAGSRCLPSRRWRRTGLRRGGLAPALVALALWKYRGYGHAARCSAAACRARGSPLGVQRPCRSRRRRTTSTSTSTGALPAATSTASASTSGACASLRVARARRHRSALLAPLAAARRSSRRLALGAYLRDQGRRRPRHRRRRGTFFRLTACPRSRRSSSCSRASSCSCRASADAVSPAAAARWASRADVRVALVAVRPLIVLRRSFRVAARRRGCRSLPNAATISVLQAERRERLGTVRRSDSRRRRPETCRLQRGRSPRSHGQRLLPRRSAQAAMGYNVLRARRAWPASAA